MAQQVGRDLNDIPPRIPPDIGIDIEAVDAGPSSEIGDDDAEGQEKI